MERVFLGREEERRNRTRIIRRGVANREKKGLCEEAGNRIPVCLLEWSCRYCTGRQSYHLSELHTNIYGVDVNMMMKLPSIWTVLYRKEVGGIRDRMERFALRLTNRRPYKQPFPCGQRNRIATSRFPAYLTYSIYSDIIQHVGFPYLFLYIVKMHGRIRKAKSELCSQKIPRQTTKYIILPLRNRGKRQKVIFQILKQCHDTPRILSRLLIVFLVTSSRRKVNRSKKLSSTLFKFPYNVLFILSGNRQDSPTNLSQTADILFRYYETQANCQ